MRWHGVSGGCVCAPNEDKEAAIALLEDEMLANGSDVGKLVDLTNEKEALEAQVMELMEEWEELETLLSRVAA